MELKQTIAELERQAAQYTEAANALRALLNTQPAKTSAARSTSNEEEEAPRKRGPQKGSRRGRRAMSPETRAKIAEKVKASHAARRAEQEQEPEVVSHNPETHEFSTPEVEQSI